MNKDDQIREVIVRFYGGSQRSAQMALTYNGLPGSPDRANKLLAAARGWDNYKIDVKICMLQNRFVITSIIPQPSTSVMVLRASNVVLPHRNGKLGKHGYGIKRREILVKEGRLEKTEYKYYGHNINMENVYRIAKQISPKSLSTSFKGTVKQVLGTVDTLGIFVDNEHPKKVIERIDSGCCDMPSESDIIPFLDDQGCPILNPEMQEEAELKQLEEDAEVASLFTS